MRIPGFTRCLGTLAVAASVVACRTGFSEPMCTDRESQAVGRVSADSRFADGHTSAWCYRLVQGEKQRWGAYRSWWSNGKKATVGAFREGVPHGYWRYWDPNGTVTAEGAFVSGRRQGPWLLYPSGRESVLVRVPFHDGREHGVLESWDERGVKITEESLVDGKPHGSARTWSSEGHLLAEFEWRHGVEHGIRRYFYANGRVRATDTIAEGVLEGPARRFYPSGAKLAEGSYAGGRPDGAWRYWSSEGELSKVEHYVGGELAAIEDRSLAEPAVRTCIPQGQLRKEWIGSMRTAIWCDLKQGSAGGWYTEWVRDSVKATETRLSPEDFES